MSSSASSNYLVTLSKVQQHHKKNPDFLPIALNYLASHTTSQPLPLPPLTPQLAFLSIPSHATQIAHALATKHPVLMDYASTFGVAFHPDIRPAIGKARREQPPYDTVSIVTTYSKAFEWINFDRTHPHLRSHLSNHTLKILESISFIRFPANSQAKIDVPNYGINAQQEIQVFVVPETEPLMSTLKKNHGLNYYMVRSSNFHGLPEQYENSGAFTYATQIAAKFFALLYPEKLNLEKTRQRTGSQPIIKLPDKSGPPDIRLVRAGNTHPQTIQRLLSPLLTDLHFTYSEEKNSTNRVLFNPLTTNPNLTSTELKNILITAAGNHPS